MIFCYGSPNGLRQRASYLKTESQVLIECVWERLGGAVLVYNRWRLLELSKLDKIVVKRGAEVKSGAIASVRNTFISFINLCFIIKCIQPHGKRLL